MAVSGIVFILRKTKDNSVLKEGGSPCKFFWPHSIVYFYHCSCSALFYLVHVSFWLAFFVNLFKGDVKLSFLSIVTPSTFSFWLYPPTKPLCTMENFCPHKPSQPFQVTRFSPSPSYGRTSLKGQKRRY